MNLFNLFAKLTLDNSEYENKMKDSEKTASSFSSKAGVAFKAAGRVVTAFAATIVSATTALSALAVKTIDYSGDVDDNAQRLGLSTEAYQKWAMAIKLGGAETTTFKTAIRELTNFTTELSDGQGEALLALQNLGIGYEDFMAMPIDERLQAVIEGLQGIEDQSEKTELAQQILGMRAYQELMPILNQEKGYIDELFQSVEDLGLVMSEDTIQAGAALGDKLDFLKEKVKILGLSFGASLFPQISKILDGLMSLANGSKEAGKAIAEGIVEIINNMVNSLPQMIDQGVDLLIVLIDGIVATLPQIVPQLTKLIESLLLKVIEVLPSLTNSLLDIAIALIDGLLKLDWGTLILELVETVVQFLATDLPNAMANIVNLIFDTIFNLLFTQEGLSKLADFGKKLAEALINGLLESWENGLNILIDGINKILSIKLPDWLGGGSIGFTIPKVKFPRVDFANGGMFDDVAKGTLYALAGEDGAEIVAHGSKGTGVANVEQIADAQYLAMNEYDIKGIIADAAVAIVNGIVTGLKANNNQSNTNVIVKIGEKEFKSYVVQLINDTLQAKGRKTLNTITAY